MSKTIGRVISVENDGWAQVIARRGQSCGQCNTSIGCCSGNSNRAVTSKVLNKAGARKGDMVSINLETGKVLKNAALIYLIPVAGLMTGALLGDSMGETLNWSQTAASIGLGFMGLIVGFIITVLISKLFSMSKKNIPMIDKIMKDGKDIHLEMTIPVWEHKKIRPETTSE